MTTNNTVATNNAADLMLRDFIEHVWVTKHIGLDFFASFCTVPEGIKEEDSYKKENFVLTNEDVFSKFLQYKGIEKDADYSLGFDGNKCPVFSYKDSWLGTDVTINFVVTNFTKVDQPNPVWLNILAYQKGWLLKEDLVALIDEYDYHTLSQQVYKRLLADKSKPTYSLLTHKFKNVVSLMRNMHTLWLSDVAEEDFIIDHDSFILPMLSKAVVRQKTSKFTYQSDFNKTETFNSNLFEWVEDGLHVRSSKPKTGMDIKTPNQRFLSQLLYGLVDPDQLDEVKKFNITIMVNTGKGDFVLSDNEEIKGYLPILTDKEGKDFITPLAKSERNFTVISSKNHFFFGTDRFYIVAPTDMTEEEAMAIFTDFFYYLDCDINFKTGQYFGGGSSVLRTLAIDKVCTHFTEEDRLSNYIVTDGVLESK